MRFFTPLNAIVYLLASVSKPLYTYAQEAIKETCLATQVPEAPSFLYKDTAECDADMKHYAAAFDTAFNQPSQNTTLKVIYNDAEATFGMYQSDSPDATHDPEAGTKFGVTYFARNVNCDMLDSSPNFFEPWKELVAPVLSTIASSLTNPSNAQKVPRPLRMECDGSMDMVNFSPANCYLV